MNTNLHTILIADDEKLLRWAICQAFTKAGFKVITVTDGSQALAELEKTKFKIDLIISDYKMPNLNGLELYRQSSQINPALKFVIITAYKTEVERLLGEDTVRVKILQKPFDLEELQQIVNQQIAEVNK